MCETLHTSEAVGDFSGWLVVLEVEGCGWMVVRDSALLSSAM